jgi:hypothetical protein
MYRNMSRAQRETIFLELAARMYSDLEDWYDKHPEASFGDIEETARRLRRELMGETLTVLINGRDTGFQVERPQCEGCDEAMDFKEYRGWGISGLEGETRLMRAYYVCPRCEGETLFPPG